MKEGAKVNKKVTCKKVNRYTKEMCNSELARLNEMKDMDSTYRRHIEKQLVVLGN